jgi:hypothetical protein
LTPGPGGVLYAGYGNGIFSLTPPASPGGAWSLNTIYTFNEATEGDYPFSLVRGADGVLYGTNAQGGPGNGGTLFSLTPPSSPDGAWTETTLLQFGVSGVGTPSSSLIPGQGGFYAISAVANNVVWLAPPAIAGEPWTETAIYSIPVNQGSAPAGLALGPGGVLYGINSFDGTFNDGTVFALTPPASPGGSWTESLIYEFGTNANDGRYPSAVTVAADGVIYGVTSNGTGYNGTAFSVTPPANPGDAWSEAVIHDFGTSSDDGEFPNSIIVTATGKLAGTTSGGGVGEGTVFWLTPPASPGGDWTEKLFRFPRNRSDGWLPTFVISVGNTLYGSTSQDGTIFSLLP